mmetsp:Transcript_17971/g.22011  ORF Transcript_17971/g.22011 Transcript_17971/m.22011 type:complete len:347 (-) Transcript_17971:81-1121(-)
MLVCNMKIAVLSFGIGTTLVASFSVPSPLLKIPSYRNEHGQRLKTRVSAEILPSEVEIKLTDVEAEIIANNVKEIFRVPYLPDVVENVVVKEVILAFMKAGPVTLPPGVFNKLILGEGSANDLTDAVIYAISDEIDIPIISREVQNSIVKTVCSVMFSDPDPMSGKVKRQMAGRAVRDASHANSKIELAKKLDQMIDVPFISKKTKQNLELELVDIASSAFENLVPQSIKDVLEASSPDELQDVRLNIIDRLNKQIDIPFKSEEEEGVYFEIMVDFLLDRYGLAKGSKNPADELKDVLHKLEKVEVELEAQRIVDLKKEKEYLTKQNSLLARKKELSDILKGKKEE